MRYGFWPCAESSSTACWRQLSRWEGSVKIILAPERESSKRLPCRTAGGSPARTRTQPRPILAAAAATWRQWLDWTAPVLTSVSQPRASASATRYSNFRVLFPPGPRPVRSSRLMNSRGPPSSALRRGRPSTGVGRWASLRRLIMGCLLSILSLAASTHHVEDARQGVGVEAIQHRPGGEVPRANMPGCGAVEAFLESEHAPH